MTGLTQSYASGTSDVPLIGATIGAQFDAAVGRWGARDGKYLIQECMGVGVGCYQTNP